MCAWTASTAILAVLTLPRFPFLEKNRSSAIAKEYIEMQKHKNKFGMQYSGLAL